MTQQALPTPYEKKYKILHPSMHAHNDHGFILNTLQQLATEQNFNKTNFWTLTQYALNTIRALQKDVTDAHNLLVQKNEQIELLERLATTDPLTGLMNRRGFLDAMEKELCKTNRDKIEGGLVIIIDLDNFKMINDTHGHEAGDEALNLVAQTLNAHIRKMDTAARLGGDEFILIFANAHPIEASARLQKLARKLNSLSLKWNGDHLPIRASLGIHAYEKGDSMNKVLSNADSDMYKAKKEKQKTRH
jgi:diguanylate cyclase (GGDEF)-like protein